MNRFVLWTQGRATKITERIVHVTIEESKGGCSEWHVYIYTYVARYQAAKYDTKQKAENAINDMKRVMIGGGKMYQFPDN